LRFVGSELGIDLKKTFNVSSFSFSHRRMTLNEYCSENELDCEIIIKELNTDLNEMHKATKLMEKK